MTPCVGPKTCRIVASVAVPKSVHAASEKRISSETWRTKQKALACAKAFRLIRSIMRLARAGPGRRGRRRGVLGIRHSGDGAQCNGAQHDSLGRSQSGAEHAATYDRSG